VLPNSCCKSPDRLWAPRVTEISHPPPILSYELFDSTVSYLVGLVCIAPRFFTFIDVTLPLPLLRWARLPQLLSLSPADPFPLDATCPSDPIFLLGLYNVLGLSIRVVPCLSPPIPKFSPSVDFFSFYRRDCSFLCDTQFPLIPS